MKHRLRHSPLPGQPSASNGHKAITINDSNASAPSSCENSKLHGRRRNQLWRFSPVLKILTLAVGTATVALVILNVFIPPFRNAEVTGRILFNAPSSFVRMRMSTKYLPRKTMYPFDQLRPSARRRRTELFNKESIMMSERYARKLEDSHDWNKKARDPLYEGDCIPMRPWQEMLFPSCSRFHEMDISNLHSSYRVDKKGRLDRRFRKINSGGYNDVFNFHTDPPNEENVVCKVLTYGTEYTDRNYDRVRRDALIMERGTKSPYLVDVYGHCGLSLVSVRTMILLILVPKYHPLCICFTFMLRF